MSRQHRLLLVFLALFILPIVLAQVAFMAGWLKGGATVNKGELINPPLSAQALFEDDHLWRLVYVMPASCQAACQESLYILGQTHLALGKEMDRVQPLVLGKAPTQVTDYPGLAFKGGAATAPLQPGQLYIADPRGFVMLRYLPVQDRQQSLRLGKDMLTDLKKLLKQSQIG
ncbi:hypothetical protein [Gallaecimonas xiamenensis]|uniref:Transmembrane cytochrome oxidase associated protein n=1 Tax=Gallaecimonas xiamenensis 3-C-1 TaxID=745411 RepID=K2KJK3_9GAMM|nr:hypothetical protein [Gallaecimonas xiamenensis]EKE77495.1 hypothetical protein B3C1_01750 [Gallaecimonas xiamenensis 3-C-1]